MLASSRQLDDIERGVLQQRFRIGSQVLEAETVVIGVEMARTRAFQLMRQAARAENDNLLVALPGRNRTTDSLAEVMATLRAG